MTIISISRDYIGLAIRLHFITLPSTSLRYAQDERGEGSLAQDERVGKLLLPLTPALSLKGRGS